MYFKRSKLAHWRIFKSGQKFEQVGNFLGHFVKSPIKPLGKIFRTQKQITKIFFPVGATRA